SAAADPALVAATAHRIKGASRSVGAAAMGEASEALEAAARRGDWVELRARLAEARREADRLSAHLADASQAHAGLAQEARR
ncbi:MAG TPA: Hpt domain-containing protein, partial [Usitatibacter sp.]|nr:Hpt domain-containing protein [Usitatibacter sp.]